MLKTKKELLEDTSNPDEKRHIATVYLLDVLYNLSIENASDKAMRRQADDYSASYTSDYVKRMC